jgi:hypothetical protein
LGIALSLALVACGGDPQGSTIRSAQVGADSLILDLDLRFSATQLAALDHGIPLQLSVRIDGAGAHALRTIEMRFRPLARQYELQLPSDSNPRLFASRARMLAALDRVRIDAIGFSAERARVELVSSALPPSLRLPALIDPDWRLATPSVAFAR